MEMIIYGYLASLSYGALCLAIAAILYKCGVPTLYTRKITHILVGFEWIILYHFFEYNFAAYSSSKLIHIFFICLIFTAIVTTAYVKDLFPAISSSADNSGGTVYFCLAMTFMSFLAMHDRHMLLPFGVGALCTSLGDGFSGIFGQIKKHNRVIYKNKTLFGTVACFVFSLASVAFISLVYKLELSFPFMIVIALISAELELISSHGLDNITVTVGTALVTYLSAMYPEKVTGCLLSLILTLPIIMLVRSKSALTKSATVAAVLLDILASLAFGNIGFVVLIIFFSVSLISDKIKAKVTAEKKETRNMLQVLANGGIGAIMSVLSMIFSGRIWFVAFCATFAEALADTVSSGVGRLSKVTVDPFRRKKVESGTSGGMSIIGTISAILCSCLIASVPVITDTDYKAALAVFLGSTLGTLLDTLLGSLVQIKYKCKVCGKMTESPTHCGEAAEKHSGISFIDNNAVNFFSTAASALLAALIFLV